MFVFTQLHLSFFGRLLVIGLIIASFFIQHGGAAPAMPDAKHLETLDSARLIRFADGVWWFAGTQMFDPAPVVVPANPRAYAVVEVTLVNLSSPLQVRLIDSDSNAVLDTLHMPIGPGNEVKTSIPLVAESVRVQLAADPGTGAVISIARVLVPSPRSRRFPCGWPWAHPYRVARPR
jgi:hypothetical protein